MSDYSLAAPPLIKGICVPLLTALDSKGRLDIPSQERLLARVVRGEAGLGAQAVFSNGTSGEWSRLSAAHTKASTEIARDALAGAGGLGLWAGCSAKTVAGVLANLEHAIKLGVSAAVIAPLAVEDAPDCQALFHRHVTPLFQRLGKGLPVFLYDNPQEYRHGRQDHLRTREVKHLARLDYVCGVKVSASATVAGNYLRGARQFKARHEFGVYLGSALQAFQLFKPARGPLGAALERWRRYWVASEPPQGLVPGSANLFPSAWRQAWSACVAGDVERMAAFEAVFTRLHNAYHLDGQNKIIACMKLALAEEGVIASPSLALGTPGLSSDEKRAWLLDYALAKKELGSLSGVSKPGLQSVKPASVSLSDARSSKAQLWGFGAAVVDEIIPVRAFVGADSKQKTAGSAERFAGGVVLNQLAWASVLGLPSQIVGAAGSDEGAGFLRRDAARLGVGTLHWPAKPGLSVDKARIFVDPQGERAIYLEPGATCKQSVADARALGSRLGKGQVLVTEVSLLPLGSLIEALKQARRHDSESFLDLDVPPKLATGAQGLGTAAQLKQALELATHVKVSLAGARELLPKSSGPKLALGLHKKLKKAPGAWVTVTLGVKGALLTDGKTVFSQSAFKVKAVDTTGCGDAFHAALIAACVAKLAPKAALRLACAAGAVAATHPGAVPTSGDREAALKLFGQPWPLAPLASSGVSRGDAAEHLRVTLSELSALSDGSDISSIEAAKDLILNAEAQGARVHITGVGKCEYVAGYVASSYSSTGTPAFFLHATEAGHGASGQVRPGDLIIAISNSGETDELKNAVRTLKKNGAKILGVSGKPQSWLAHHSDAFLYAGVRREGDDLNLAPRASVLAEILVLNALGVALQHHKKFTANQFRAYHPGVSLGKDEA